MTRAEIRNAVDAYLPERIPEEHRETLVRRILESGRDILDPVDVRDYMVDEEWITPTFARTGIEN